MTIATFFFSRKQTQRLIAQGVLLKKVRSKNQTKMILPSQMTEMPETETMMNENQNADRNYQRDYDYDDDEHRCGVGGYGGSSWFEW